MQRMPMIVASYPSKRRKLLIIREMNGTITQRYIRPNHFVYNKAYNGYYVIGHHNGNLRIIICVGAAIMTGYGLDITQLTEEQMDSVLEQHEYINERDEEGEFIHNVDTIFLPSTNVTN